VCPLCLAGLRSAPERLLPGGIRLVPAFEHEGVARNLMHLLKYQGLGGFAGLAAANIAPRLPRTALVPVPRVLSRRLRYGVDPALLLARSLATRLGVEVCPVLAAPLHAERRAGGDHRRPAHQFRLRRPPPDRLVLVDDVVTTGATVLAAVEALGVSRVVAVAAANTVSGVSSVLAL
jgi:predicted amidophosphoribosyltransferase